MSEKKQIKERIKSGKHLRSQKYNIFRRQGPFIFTETIDTGKDEEERKAEEEAHQKYLRGRIVTYSFEERSELKKINSHIDWYSYEGQTKKYLL